MTRPAGLCAGPGAGLALCCHPPGLPLPSDPRTWPAWKRALRAHRWFLTPGPPFNEDQQAYAHFAARAVVRGVMLAFDLRRFPEKRWIDWLCRRAEAYARLSRRLRPRLTGPHDREWLRVYMRNWLYRRHQGDALQDFALMGIPRAGDFCCVQFRNRRLALEIG